MGSHAFLLPNPHLLTSDAKRREGRGGELKRGGAVGWSVVTGSTAWGFPESPPSAWPVASKRHLPVCTLVPLWPHKAGERGLAGSAPLGRGDDGTRTLPTLLKITCTEGKIEERICNKDRPFCLCKNTLMLCLQEIPKNIITCIAKRVRFFSSRTCGLERRKPPRPGQGHFRRDLTPKCQRRPVSILVHCKRHLRPKNSFLETQLKKLSK